MSLSTLLLGTNTNQAKASSLAAACYFLLRLAHKVDQQSRSRHRKQHLLQELRGFFRGQGNGTEKGGNEQRQVKSVRSLVPFVQAACITSSSVVFQGRVKNQQSVQCRRTQHACTHRFLGPCPLSVLQTRCGNVAKSIAPRPPAQSQLTVKSPADESKSSDHLLYHCPHNPNLKVPLFPLSPRRTHTLQKKNTASTDAVLPDLHLAEFLSLCYNLGVSRIR